MLLKKQEEENVVEALFDSSDIFKTIYLKEKNKIYFFFRKGNVYQYENFDINVYEEFEEAESQGVYFATHIRSNKLYPFKRITKMKDFERNELSSQITTIKEQLNNERDIQN